MCFYWVLRRGVRRYTAAEKQLLSSSAEIFALIIENARLTERAMEQEKLRRDLALAAEVQRRLLPSHAPHSGDATLAAFSLPARTVGGDYYDFLDLRRRADRNRRRGYRREGHRGGAADVGGAGIAAGDLSREGSALVAAGGDDEQVSLPVDNRHQQVRNVLLRAARRTRSAAPVRQRGVTIRRFWCAPPTLVW